ncbi:MAG: hypothetical protein K9H64_06505 [Bacteroidales bacterium]|nr:hypothetical protein [Bacteroidales bacterium]MCF8455348.1 hypothetical protein [Bacteroidales bacterium]
MADIKANKRTLIRWKIYIDRARMYIGYIQFIMIGFVFIEAYRNTTIGNLIFDNIWISIPIVFILFITLSLIIGRLDTVHGLREEELRNVTTSNPVMRDIQASLEEIKEELKGMKNQNQDNR